MMKAVQGIKDAARLLHAMLEDERSMREDNPDGVQQDGVGDEMVLELERVPNATQATGKLSVSYCIPFGCGVPLRYCAISTAEIQSPQRKGSAVILCSGT